MEENSGDSGERSENFGLPSRKGRSYYRLKGKYVQLDYGGTNVRWGKLLTLEDGTAILKPFVDQETEPDGWLHNYWNKLEGVFQLGPNLIGMTPTTKRNIDTIIMIKNSQKEKNRLDGNKTAENSK